MLKRWVPLILTGCMVLGLAACGGSGDGASDSSGGSQGGASEAADSGEVDKLVMSFQGFRISTRRMTFTGWRMP